MAARLIIHFDGARAAWLDAGKTLARGPLAEAAARAAAREVSVLLPSEQILITDVRLPPIRQAGRRLQAARYALEDRLVARVETVHVALAAGADDRGITTAAVIDAARLRDYLSAFAAAGLDVAAVGPDVLALPAPAAGEWQLALLGERLLARTGARHGFACEPALWPLLAEGAETPPERLVAHAADGERAAELVAGEDASKTAPVIETRAYDGDDAVLAALLEQAAASAPAINLRQGAAARTSAMQAWWQPFKLTVGLAAAGLVLAIAARGVQNWRLHQQIDRLQATSLRAFHDAFPDVKQINDLRVQAEQNIRALRGQDSSGGVFLLLQATAKVTAGAGDLNIRSLQYRDGTLYLNLHGSNVRALETLRAGFAQQAEAKLTVDSADAASSGVRIQASVARVRPS